MQLLKTSTFFGVKYTYPCTGLEPKTISAAEAQASKRIACVKPKFVMT